MIISWHTCSKPVDTVAPRLLTHLFQRSCNTRTTALERLCQQPWNSRNNCCGTTVSKAVVMI